MMPYVPFTFFQHSFIDCILHLICMFEMGNCIPIRIHFWLQVQNILSPQLDRSALATACEALNIAKLCDQDYAFLTEYVAVIKPIADAITYLEASVKTFGCYLPMLFSTRQKFIELRTKDELVYCGPLLDAVRDGFSKRFGHLLHLGDIYEEASPKAIPLFLAMLTNPDYRLAFIPSSFFDRDASGIAKIRSILMNAMKQLLESDRLSRERELPAAEANKENTNPNTGAAVTSGITHRN